MSSCSRPSVSVKRDKNANDRLSLGFLLLTSTDSTGYGSSRVDLEGNFVYMMDVLKIFTTHSLPLVILISGPIFYVRVLVLLTLRKQLKVFFSGSNKSKTNL